MVSSSPTGKSNSSMEAKVEHLFETQSLTELRAVERKFHADIEKKRQDLRLLVGERYKDVIDVSDKLTGITAHSSQMKSRLERMQELCSDLKRKQQNNQMSDSTPDSTVYSAQISPAMQSKDKHDYLSLACQLKLLSLVPENVLLFLDQNEYIRAAQLVKFSKCLRSSLIGPLNENADLIRQKFPIVSRISTNQIKSTVRQSLQQHLINICKSEDEMIENVDETKAEKFVAIVEAYSILEELSSVDAIIQCLDILSDHLVHLLTSDSTTQTVCDVLSEVSRLVYFINYCVAATVDKFARESVKESADSCRKDSVMFEELCPNQANLKSFLPENVKNCDLSNSELEKSDATDIVKEIVDPLNEMLVEKLKQHVEKQLSYVRSIKSLTNVKTKLLEIERASKSVVQPFALEKLNLDVGLWKSLFEPIFTSCVKRLVKESALKEWDAVWTLLQDRICPLFEKPDPSPLQPTATPSELDAPSHVWTEEISFGDVNLDSSSVSPTRLKETQGKRISAGQSETPAIICVGRKIDAIIDKIKENCCNYFTPAVKTQPGPDLNSLYGFSSPDKKEPACEDLDELCVEITGILVQKLLAFVSTATEEPNLVRCEVLFRLLNYLVCNAKAFHNFHRTDLSEKCFDQLHNLIFDLQEKWLKCLIEEATSQLIKENDKCDDLGKIKSQFLAANWELVDIQEETEDGRSIVTKLSIPIKASHPVHSLLFMLTNGLNRVTPLLTSENILKHHRASRHLADPSSQSKSPHSKPFLISADVFETFGKRLGDLLNERLVVYYKSDLYPKVSNCKDTKLMIQIIYDIKFLCAFLKASSESVSSTADLEPGDQRERLQDVIYLYENHVDPFDYDVFSEHLSEKLSQELFQSQHIYGHLLGSSNAVKNQMSATSSSMSSKGATGYHNLCQLVSNPVKFQPLSVPHSAASFGSKRSTNLQPVTLPQGQSSTAANVSSNASSLSTPDKFSAGSALLKGWFAQQSAK